MRYLILIAVALLIACADPVDVNISESSVEVVLPDGQRVSAPMEAITFNGLEHLPTPTPVPTPGPAVTPTAALPSIGTDFVTAMEADLAVLERMVKRAIGGLGNDPGIADLDWVEDGIDSRVEANAVLGLVRLVNNGFAIEASSLLAESWVDDGSNHVALAAFAQMGEVSEPEPGVVVRFEDVIRTVFAHSRFSDGVSADEAKVLATLETVGYPLKDRIEVSNYLVKFLDSFVVESRTITLPRTGVVEISIVHTGLPLRHDHASAFDPDGVMDKLEHSVRGVEEFIDHPFPQRQIIMLFPPHSVKGGALFRDTHVVFWEDGSRVRHGDILGGGLTHEVGHWHFGVQTNSQAWIAEGAVELMRVVINPDPALESPTCGVVRNLSEFEALPFDPKGSGANAYDDCKYALGLALFNHLYAVMDEDNFQQGIRRLSLHIEHDAGECSESNSYGVRWTSVCHVREAFTTHADTRTAVKVREIIDLHYDGDPPHIDVTVTGPGSEKVALATYDSRGRIESWVYARPDGTASMRLPAGTHNIGVHVASVNEQGGTDWGSPVKTVEVVFDGLTTVQVEIDL